MSEDNSAVECDLAKVEVAGSIPVPRSIILNSINYQLDLFTENDLEIVNIHPFLRPKKKLKKVSGNCKICGIWRQGLDEDHIYPRWKCRRDGWTIEQAEDPKNKQYICQNCHYDKNRIDEIGKTEFCCKKNRRCSEETKLKISQANRRAFKLNPRIVTKESIEKRRITNTGKKRSEEFRNRMRILQTGRIASQETKDKIRISRIGKHLSEESKAKISSFNKGKIISEEQKAKVSAVHKGKIVSIETRSKISLALRLRREMRNINDNNQSS